MAEKTAEPIEAAPKATARRRDPLALVVRFQSLIGLVVVVIGGVIFSPRRHGEVLFLDPDNIANIVRAVSETGIIAIGMTFVIITAGIDLSVGAVLGLSSVVTASMMISGGFGLVPTILVVLVMGIVFGAIQGTISTRFRLEPFIVTLAGLQAARGLALVVSGNQYINISYGAGPGAAGVLGAGRAPVQQHRAGGDHCFHRLRRYRHHRAQHHALRPLCLRCRRQRT